MRTKKTIFILCFTLSLMLVGCSKLMNTKNETIVAKIVTTECVPIAWMGAKWNTILEYNGMVCQINNEDVYNMCLNNDSKEVECVLTTKYYEDGTKKSYITKVNGLK